MTEVKEWVRMKPQKTAELTRKLKGIELSDDDTATDQISKFFSDMIEAHLTQTETADLLFQVSVKIADFKAKQMRNRGLQLNQQHYHRLREEQYDQLKAVYDDLCKESQSTETNTTQHHHTQPNTTTHNPTPPSGEDHFIKSLLAGGRPKVSQFKSGVHDGTLYFGTVLYEGKRKIPAVITSDKNIYLNRRWKGEGEDTISSTYGLFYRYDFEIDALDSHWSTEGISKYLYSPDAPKSIAELFKTIRDTNKRYMQYPDVLTHSVIALDIISTYFLPVFAAKGRTFFECEPGSGKTRQGTLYKLQACNAIMTNDVTKAAFFRIMESTCSTLIVDDFDDLDDEQKRDILQHYKTGYKNSSRTIRSGDDKKRSLDAFRNYGHCVMNNTTGLDDISADRSIFIPLLKVNGEVTTRNINEQDVEWQTIRDDLYACALANWKLVKESYDGIQTTFSGRRLEITRPLIAIAALVSPELKADIEKWLEARFDDYQSVQNDGDWFVSALKQFADARDGETKKIVELAREIALETLNEEDRNFRKHQHGIAIYLGKKFRSLPLFKVVTINGTKCVKLLSKEKYDAYGKLRGWHWVVLGGVGNAQRIFQQCMQPGCSDKESRVVSDNKWYCEDHIKADGGEL